MLKRQFGQFLLLVGSVVMILFVISYAADQLNFWLFLAGAGLLFWGGHILIHNPGQPRPKAERFRAVRKISARKKKDDKKDKKESKEKNEEEDN